MSSKTHLLTNCWMVFQEEMLSLLLLWRYSSQSKVFLPALTRPQALPWARLPHKGGCLVLGEGDCLILKEKKVPIVIFIRLTTSLTAFGLLQTTHILPLTVLGQETCVVLPTHL